MAQQKRTQTLQVPVTLTTGAPPANGESKHASVTNSPFFADVGDEGEEVLDHIAITRLKPLREGNLGVLAPDATEDDIREQFGGGTYALWGRTERNKPIKGAYRTCDIAGDPIFQTPFLRRRWQRMQRQENAPDTDGATPPAPDGVEKPLTFQQLMIWQQQQNASREQAAEAAHQRDLARIREQAKADKEAAELRLQEVEKKLEADRKRDKEDAQERRERDREFMAAQQALMLQVVSTKDKRDPIETMIAGMQIAVGMASGDKDPLTAAIENGPAIFDGIKDVVREARGNPEGGEGRAPKKLAKDEIMLKGDVGTKWNRAVAHLQKMGKNPEAVLSTLADQVLQVKPKAKTAAGEIQAKATPKKPAGKS